MTEFKGKDWTIDNDNRGIKTSFNYTTFQIHENEVGDMVETILDNLGVRLTENAVECIEGKDYDDIFSIMLACGITLSRMNRQIDTQGGTDEQFREIMDTAVDVRSRMLNVTHDEALKQMMEDDEAFDVSVSIAKQILGYGVEGEEDESVG